MTVIPSTVIDFWFSKTTSPKWFEKDPAFDAEISRKFLFTYKAARTGDLNDWMDTPEGALALVIVLDQFPRNMFRDKPMAFETDAAACHHALLAIEKGYDRALTSEQRIFLYMPFMHAENLNIQKKSLQLYLSLGLETNLKFAKAHHDIIERFGRFPHRNAILSRPTTPEEAAFLKEPGSSF